MQEYLHFCFPFLLMARTLAVVVLAWRLPQQCSFPAPLFAPSRPSYSRHIALGRERCRPAREVLNASVAHAACGIFLQINLHISKIFCNFAAQNQLTPREVFATVPLCDVKSKDRRKCALHR